MAELQRREAGEGEALAARQWQLAQRNIAVEQWQAISTLRNSRFEPIAAQQTVDKLFPSHADIFSNDAPSNPGLTNDEITRRVNVFVNSLPNQPKALMGTLDQLLRQRLNDWQTPNPGELGVWSGCCKGILDKLVNINNQAEYKDSFHNHSAQEVWQTLRKKRASDDCWNSWQRAYSDVLTLIPHNRSEEQEPEASKQREQALRSIENAESKSWGAPMYKALPVIPTSGTMPPLAPQHQRFQRPGDDVDLAEPPAVDSAQRGNGFANQFQEADTNRFPRRRVKF